eukprot:364605-Chlamydomonas_euryale.AAC.3
MEELADGGSLHARLHARDRTGRRLQPPPVLKEASAARRVEGVREIGGECGEGGRKSEGDWVTVEEGATTAVAKHRPKDGR